MAPAPNRDTSLRELSREFLDESIDGVGGLRGLDVTDAESRDRARRLAHNLKGTGGTFGFRTVSDAARELERALSGSADDPSVLVEALAAALTAARAGLDEGGAA